MTHGCVEDIGPHDHFTKTLLPVILPASALRRKETWRA